MDLFKMKVGRPKGQNNKEVKFQMRMTEDDMYKLDILSDLAKKSKAEYVRDIINERFIVHTNLTTLYGQ